jgi:hypothetical protein
VALELATRVVRAALPRLVALRIFHRSPRTKLRAGESEQRRAAPERAGRRTVDQERPVAVGPSIATVLRMNEMQIPKADQVLQLPPCSWNHNAECRVRPRVGRAGFCQKVVDELVEFNNTLGLSGGKVLLLAKIVVEVV